MAVRVLQGHRCHICSSVIMALLHVMLHQSHYIAVGVLNECKSPLLLKMLSSVRASSSNLAQPFQTFEIGGCVSAAVVFVWIANCFKRASLTYRRAYLTFYTESSELLISSDFR